VTTLVQVAAVIVVPIALLIAFSQILGAPHRPGDGFTAGIISSLGLTLHYVVFGRRRARAMLRVHGFDRVLMAGLIVAYGAAVLPMVVDRPLLGSVAIGVEISPIGTISLSRGLIFDLGIYLVVLGGAMAIADSIGRARQP
jgi:multisubunit Na+/H+ antiporter MnhB subunit